MRALDTSTRHRGRPRRDDGGAGTVLVIAMAGLLMFVLVGLVAVSGLVAAQRRAQAAADLAALGAAGAGAGADAGPEARCEEAARIAKANGAALTGCSAVAREVRVEVVVPGPPWPGRRVQVLAEARAGPG